MSLPAAASAVLASFDHCPGWEQRARLLMQLGEGLEPLAEAERSAANRVTGCESQVWLVAAQAQGIWHFRAGSDARLIRGLLAVLLARVNGLPAAQLEQVDIAAWLAQLGLSRHLSPSRANGLNAVMKRIGELASA